MPDDFSKLRAKIQQTLEVERIKQQLPKVTRANKFWATFVRAQMDARNYTAPQVAKMLGVKPEVLDFLLQEDFPDWMISDELLVRLSKILDVPTNQFRVMLRRKIKPAVDRV